MSQLIDISHFSKYLADSFCYSGEPITNKKLQKLLYYTQAWHLVYFDTQLFNELPEAWVHGPVYPSVYDRYKRFQSKPIWNDENHPLSKTVELFNSFGFSEEQKDFLEAILKYYGGRSALELELLSHREQPWLEARNGLADYDISANKISVESMKNYYTSLKRSKESDV